MELQIQSLITVVTDLVIALWHQITQPIVIYQLVLISVLLITSRFIAIRLKPVLEDQARTIKGKPGLLRFIVIGLRRLRWAVLVILLLLAIAVMQAFNWPASFTLTYNVFLLAFAWLVISVMSNTIRSRFVARVIAMVGWSFVAVSILGISDEAAELLDSVDFSIGASRISLFLIIKAFFFLGATLWIAISAGNAVERRIQRSEELTPSLRVLVGKILKITFIAIALLVAVSGIGVDLTLFTVLSGAIGVGIGFGLQKVVSNLISGIIILADRSIKPGDTISVGETFGWIRELRARFVSVITRDGREYLIPNEDFITQQVINWSFSDDLVRLDVNFGVSYNSDPHQVIKLAIECVNPLSRVVSSPAPVCWLTGFGDSSLDFVLRFWIHDPQNGLTNIRGQVFIALWDSFKENNIKIPYPHREVFVHSTDGAPIPLNPESEATAATEVNPKNDLPGTV